MGDIKHNLEVVRENVAIASQKKGNKELVNYSKFLNIFKINI